MISTILHNNVPPASSGEANFTLTTLNAATESFSFVVRQTGQPGASFLAVTLRFAALPISALTIGSVRRGAQSLVLRTNQTPNEANGQWTISRVYPAFGLTLYWWFEVPEGKETEALTLVLNQYNTLP